MLIPENFIVFYLCLLGALYFIGIRHDCVLILSLGYAVINEIQAFLRIFVVMNFDLDSGWSCRSMAAVSYQQRKDI